MPDNEFRTHTTGMSPTGSALNVGSRLLGLFAESVMQRTTVELEWIKDVRQYEGVYEPEEIRRLRTRDGASMDFMRLTRTKVLTMDARIGDLVFGTGKKNWEIRPDHDPDQVEVMGLDDQDTGDPQLDQARQQEQQQITVLAARAENMDAEIWGQLKHARHVDLYRRVAHSGHLLGCGILKGPLVANRSVKRWQLVGKNGQPSQPGQGAASEADSTWQVVAEDQPTPYLEFVQVWDFYPEMEGWDLNNIEYCFQRHLFHKSDLLALAKRPTFFGDTIKAHVEARPDGDAQWMAWEKMLDEIGRYTASRAMQMRRKYEVLEYWGPVSSDELRALGKELPDDVVGMVEANLWMLRSTGEIISAVINPFAKRDRPYSFYVPEPEEGHIFGVSVPWVLRDAQRLLNSTVRNMADNATSAVLPQVLLDISRVPTAKNITAMPPGRVWAVEPDPFGSNSKAIEFADFPNHTQNYLMLAQFFKLMGDETSGIPAYQYGQTANQGVGRTAAGLSMLMGAAGLLLKNQLFAWDEFQARLVRLLFDWNMQFNKRDDIKGNFDIHVEGSMSMGLREMRAQQLTQLLGATNNPTDNQWMKRYALLWSVIEAYEMDPNRYVKSKQELMKETEEMQAQQAQQGPMQQRLQELGIDKQIAEIIQILSTAAFNNSRAQGAQSDIAMQEVQLIEGVAGGAGGPGTNPQPQSAPAPGSDTGAAPAEAPPPQPVGGAKGGQVPTMREFVDGLLNDADAPRYEA